MAALTLPVIMTSSVYSPVLSCFEVEEQPTAVISVTARKAADKNLLAAFMIESPWIVKTGLSVSSVFPMPRGDALRTA
jgi:hypothetical protein